MFTFFCTADYYGAPTANGSVGYSGRGDNMMAGSRGSSHSDMGYQHHSHHPHSQPQYSAGPYDSQPNRGGAQYSAADHGRYAGHSRIPPHDEGPITRGPTVPIGQPLAFMVHQPAAGESFMLINTS